MCRDGTPRRERRASAPGRRWTRPGVGGKLALPTPGSTGTGREPMDHEMRSRGELQVEIETAAGISEPPLERSASPDMVRHGVALLRGLMETHQVGYGVGRADGTIVDVNDAFANLLGYERRELLGLGITWKDLTPPEYAEIDIRSLAEVKRTTRPVSYAKEFFHRDGSRVPTILIAMYTSYVLEEYAAFVLDDSARQRAEANLRRSETNLRTAQLLAQMGSFELSFDPNGEVHWSDGVYRILGLPVGSNALLPGAYIERFVRPDHAGLLSSAMETLAREGRPFDITYPIVRPSGAEHWVRGIAAPLSDATGAVTGVVGTILDVTEQRQTEARLLQIQKLEVVGALARGIAHDFNNILGSVTGYTELALRAANGQPRIEAELRSIFRATERAANLASRLLLLGRTPEPIRRPLRLADVAGESLEMLRAMQPLGIVIEPEIDPATPSILGDETQILQVLLNLGTNALHAMDGGGGVLTVRLEPFDVDEDFAVRHPPLRAGLHARLSVCDTGTGIAPEIVDHVVEPFFTTKAPGEGTGLGLSIVHGIVRDHDGAIELETTPGEGTTFQIYLPAAPEADPDGREAPAPRPVPRGTGQRVLLIDDDRSLCVVTERRLEESGYEVTAFTDPLRALEAFRQRPHHFDVVVTDYSMPRLSGTALAHELHRIRPGLPVVLASGYGAALHPSAQLHAAGIRHVIAKPATEEALARTVRDALGADRGDSPVS